MLAIIPVEFDELEIVHICTKSLFNRVHVKTETVCGDLDAMRQTLRQIVNECVSGSRGTLANRETGNEFGNGVNGHEYPSISELCGIVLPAPFLLLIHEAPNFVGLYEIAFNAAHGHVKHFGAFLPGQDEQ